MMMMESSQNSSDDGGEDSTPTTPPSSSDTGGDRSETRQDFAFGASSAVFATVVRAPSGSPRGHPSPRSTPGMGNSLHRLRDLMDSLGSSSPPEAQRGQQVPVGLRGGGGHQSDQSQGTPGSGDSVPRRPARRTPPANFTIHFSSSSDDSSGGGGEGSEGEREEDPEDIFPPGCEIGANLREAVRRRMQEPQSPESVDLDGGSSQEIFGDNGSIHSAAMRRRRQLLEGRVDSGRGLRDVVMCVIWAGQRFAASYYDLETAQLFILPDMSDAGPDFDILRSAFHQICPTYLLVNKNSEESFLKVVYKLTGHVIVAPEGAQGLDFADERSDESGSVCLYQLHSKDFNPEPCKQRVQSLKLPYEPKNNGLQEHILFVSSLIPFSNVNMIRSMGCLLNFLDNKAMELFQIETDGGQVPVVDVNLFEMDDLVLVDETAWHSLQLFSTDIHPSSFKQGRSSGSKEGLSVYGLLNECVTAQGAKKLRLMLLRPSRNAELLSRRYDAIEYFLNPNQMELAKSCLDALKSVKSLPKLLYRLSLLHATVNEWKELYQTMYHCLLLGEIFTSQESAPDLLKEIGNPEFLADLRALTQEMISVIDFEQSATSNRIVAKVGLDEELDKKKRQIACLPDIMSIVASEEINDLPPYVKQCCVVYIPEVGYLLAISVWEENLSDRELEIENLEYRFRTPELIYYKSARMRELDVILGDCAVAILEKETLIMVRLSELILLKLPTLLKINDKVSEMDSLLAMSKLAKSYVFARPVLVSGEGKLKIHDGWHPLSSLLCDFVKNSTIFQGYERVAIITGPNASGKSVYLKQVGVIVLMALSGCYVPASFAQIPLFDKIFTRIHALESVSTGLSTFMIDLSQMSLAIRSSCIKSLIIIDEFGKGTAEVDGLAILAASIQDFLDREENCPTIFLSTHFCSLMKYLKSSPLLKCQTMKFVNVNGTMTYLFELIDGKCEKSFASLMAKALGVPANLVDRANEVEEVIVRQSQNPDAIESGTTEQQAERNKFMLSIADEFLKIKDFKQLDTREYVRSVKQRYAAFLKREKENNEKKNEQHEGGSCKEEDEPSQSSSSSTM